MRVIDFVRRILDESITQPLADVGIKLTNDRSGYTVARYEGEKNGFRRTVIVDRDKWMSKNRGHFKVFFVVEPPGIEELGLEDVYWNTAQSNLASLVGRKKDYWRIWVTDDAPPLIEEFSESFRAVAIPWLESLSDPQQFAKWLEHNRGRNVFDPCDFRND